MKKICLIGQFPPPIHGLSKALNTIIQSQYLKEKFDFTHIDIKNNKDIFTHLSKIKNSDADLFYFTISQTKLGNMRDMIILNALLRKKKKIVIHYHGGYYKELYKTFNPIQKKINKYQIGKVNVFIALSESLKTLFEDVIDIKKVRICENYIEEKSLMNEELFQEKLTVIKEKPVEVLYLSNFIESKGYKDILAAIKNINTNIVFNFAGIFFAEKEKVEFLNFIKNNRLGDKAIYHGLVDGESKKSLLFKSNIFILPTYYPKEGQPISIIEAMGNGLSVITTKHAGIPDIVTEKNGVLINPKSPSEIITAIDILCDSNLLIEIAKENRRKVLKNFKEIDYLKRLERIFNEVLEDES